MVEAMTDPTTNGAGTLPEYVEVAGAPRFTANELRQIRAVTGLSMEKLMEDGADVVQAFVYVKLRKLGFAPSWEEAGDVGILFLEEPSDPSSSARATPSRPSADSGG